MSILKLAATAGVVTASVLYALGKSKDKEQSEDFASNVDSDIQTLLEKAAMVNCSHQQLFSCPVPNGSLGENLYSIKLRVCRVENLYERTVTVTAMSNGRKEEFEAMRKYDSDYLPSAIMCELLKSDKSSVEWLIYSK